MELLQTFEYENLKVETYYNGTDKLPNKVYIGGKLIEDDETFRPSPLHCIDDVKTMVSLLGFLTLRKGDVDDDFFETRDSDTLVNWAEEDEEVRMMLFDYECRDDEDYLKDNEITKEYCERIEKHINYEQHNPTHRSQEVQRYLKVRQESQLPHI